MKGRVRIIVTGRKTQNVYYLKDDTVFATDVDTGATREIAKLPPRGSVATVNADETLLAGTYIEGNGAGLQRTNRPPAPQQLEQPRNKGQMMEERLAAHLPMGLFTVNTKTGEVKTIHTSTDWLNHLEFSPTDPTLLMFCHEGPWHKVDRIWTMRTDGSHITKIHTRTMAMEIFGHEFWSPDGKTIWYDLQTPRGEDFWLAGYNVETGERTWYHLQRNEWSIHFNVTRDGKLFCGDGGDEGQVAHAPDGKWIYLFRPELLPNRGIDDKSFVRPGRLPRRAPGEYVEAQVHAGAERQLHARSEMGGVPLQHVRPDLRLRRGSGQGAVSLRLAGIPLPYSRGSAASCNSTRNIRSASY